MKNANMSCHALFSNKNYMKGWFDMQSYMHYFKLAKFIIVKSGCYSGMGPPWTEAAWTGGRGGTVPTRGARALGLAGDGGEGQAGRGGARGVLT